MRLTLPIFLSLALFLLANCSGETSSTQNTTTETTTTNTTDQGDTQTDTTPPIRSSHDCTIEGQILETNQLWLREKEVLIAIVADSSTYDEEYGDGHRIFVAYDTKSCEQIFKQELPVNFSPDFPYYLAEITYNQTSQLAAIKGFKSLYCFDIENRKLLPKLDPVFNSERYGTDASAGMIQRLEVWEDHLVGYCMEFGPFVFNIEDPNNPKPLKAFAEYEIPDVGFSSLFMIESAGEGVQLILPTYEEGEGEFAINPVFDKPTKVNTNINASALNNRYIVLREDNESRTPIALDMAEPRIFELPADIAAKNTKDIVAWMKKN